MTGSGWTRGRRRCWCSWRADSTPSESLIAPLRGGKKTMFPIPKHDRLIVGHFRKLIESGEFRPVIYRTYPLDQIVEAYRYVESGQKSGNVVTSLESSR